MKRFSENMFCTSESIYKSTRHTNFTHRFVHPCRTQLLPYTKYTKNYYSSEEVLATRSLLISSSIQISHHFTSCSATKSNSCKNIKTEWTCSVLFLAEINFNLSFAQSLIIIRVSPTAPIHNLFLITLGRIFNWIRYAGGWWHIVCGVRPAPHWMKNGMQMRKRNVARL